MRYLFAIALTLPLILAGCGAASDTAGTDVQAMPDDDVHATAMGGGSMGGMMGGLNTEITVDPEIAGAWSGIRVHVVDSETGDGQIFEVALGETLALGDSGLTLSADTFRLKRITRPYGSSSPRRASPTTKAGSSPRCRRSIRSRTTATRCCWSRAYPRSESLPVV